MLTKEIQSEKKEADVRKERMFVVKKKRCKPAKEVHQYFKKDLFGGAQNGDLIWFVARGGGGDIMQPIVRNQEKVVMCAKHSWLEDKGEDGIRDMRLTLDLFFWLLH